MSIHCLIKITCIINQIPGLCLFKINVCYLIENWSKFIVCLSQFLKICQIFPVSNYLDTGILYGKSITNKRFVKQSKNEAELVIVQQI